MEGPCVPAALMIGQQSCMDQYAHGYNVLHVCALEPGKFVLQSAPKCPRYI